MSDIWLLRYYTPYGSNPTPAVSMPRELVTDGYYRVFIKSASGTIYQFTNPAQNILDVNDIEGLSDWFDGASLVNHTHDLSEIANLSSLASAAFGHRHTMLEVMDADLSLQWIVDHKALLGHTHSKDSLEPGLSSTLAGYADVDHTHTISDIAGLSAELAGKSPASHPHAISDVVGLQSVLDAKIPNKHLHSPFDIDETFLLGTAFSNDYTIRVSNVIDIASKFGSAIEASTSRICWDGKYLYFIPWEATGKIRRMLPDDWSFTTYSTANLMPDHAHLVSFADAYMDYPYLVLHPRSGEACFAFLKLNPTSTNLISAYYVYNKGIADWKGFSTTKSRGMSTSNLYSQCLIMTALDGRGFSIPFNYLNGTFGVVNSNSVSEFLPMGSLINNMMIDTTNLKMVRKEIDGTTVSFSISEKYRSQCSAVMVGNWVYSISNQKGNTVFNAHPGLAGITTPIFVRFPYPCPTEADMLPIDLTNVAGAGAGYKDIIFDRRYIWMIPNTANSPLLRFDVKKTFHPANIETFDLSPWGTSWTGVIGDNHLYLAPFEGTNLLEIPLF